MQKLVTIAHIVYLRFISGISVKEYNFNLSRSEFEELMYKFREIKGLETKVYKHIIFGDSNSDSDRDIGVVFEW